MRARVYTMPEFLERRYNASARIIFAILSLLLTISIDLSGTLYSGALFLHLLLPALSLRALVMGLAIFAIMYSTAGGLLAVMYTEILQAILLLLSACLVCGFAFARAGGWHFVMTHVSATSLSLIRPASDAALPWPGLLLGVPILGLYFWCTNQLMVQRVLAARNLEQGRWGCLFAGFLKLTVLFIMVLPGTCALLIYPHLKSGDLVFPKLVFGLLPPGLVGFAVAGFLSAVMSSSTSALNAASSIATLDLLARLLPPRLAIHPVQTGRVVMVVALCIAVLWAPEIGRFPSLWQYLQSVLAYTVPPVVAIYLAGIFWPRANAAGAVAALGAGFATGLALMAAHNLMFLLAAPLIFALSLAVIIAVSLTTPPPPPRPDLSWSMADLRADRAPIAGAPWYGNFYLLSGCLLSLTAALVWRFW